MLTIKKFTLSLNYDGATSDIEFVGFPAQGAFFAAVPIFSVDDPSKIRSHFALCIPMLANGAPELNLDPIAAEVEDWSEYPERCMEVEKHFGVRFWNHEEI